MCRHVPNRDGAEPKIMNDAVDVIKNKADIVSYIGRTVKLKKAGRNFTGLCPFHKEKSPSFFVSPDRLSWHCFGCNRGGDIYSFITEREGIDFRNALELLANETNTPLPKFQRDAHPTRNLYDLLATATRYYQDQLQSEAGKVANTYLTEKRLLSNEMVEKFQVGYSPDSWDATGSYLIQQGYTSQDLLAAGLIIEKEQKSNRSWYDRFRGRIMFPIHDNIGHHVGFSARSLDPNETGGKYVNSPETEIFKKSDILYGYHLAKEAIHQKNYAIVVEGQLDVISLHQIGIENVLAPQGSAFTTKQGELIKRLTNRIVLFFDNDNAGKKAALNALNILIPMGFDIKIGHTTTAKDPDESAHTNPAQTKLDLKNTSDYFTYLFENTKNELKNDDPQAVGKISRVILPYIALVPDSVQLESLANLLAEKLRVSATSTLKELAKYRQDQSPTKTNVPTPIASIVAPPGKPSRIKTLWKSLMAMLLQIPESLERDALVIDIVKPLQNVGIDDPQANMPHIILAQIINDGLIDNAKLNQTLNEPQRQLADILALQDNGFTDDENYIQGLATITKSLQIIYIKQEIQKLAASNDPAKMEAVKKLAQTLNTLQAWTHTI